MTLPDFLYIGTSRAGSTWLYQALNEHPQVYVPPAKDIFFFDRLYDRGIDWYAGNFPKDASQYMAVGEISHDYFQSETYLQRIKAHLPQVKLIACLREPGAQTQSVYHWWVTHGGFQGTYEEFIQSDLCISAIDYYQNLKAVYELFPREQILVVFYEELKRDPQNFLRKIYTFLAVDAAFQPSTLNVRVNARANSRNPVLTKLAYSIGQLIRSLGLGEWVGRIKFNPWIQRILYIKTDDEQEISASAVKDLRNRCREWYPALQEMLENPLPSEWTPVD